MNPDPTPKRGRPSLGHVKLHLSLHPDVKQSIEATALERGAGVSEYLVTLHKRSIRRRQLREQRGL